MSHSRFASASMVERRQMIEDALAETFDAIDGCHISHDQHGSRCLAVPVPYDDGMMELHDLWTMACQIEAMLS